jgi:hypothetical protein
VSLTVAEKLIRSASLQEIRGTPYLSFLWALNYELSKVSPALSELGVTLAEVARHVGVNTSSIAKALVRAEERQ